MPAINQVFSGVIEKLQHLVEGVGGLFSAGAGSIKNFVLRLVGREVNNIVTKTISLEHAKILFESKEIARKDGLIAESGRPELEFDLTDLSAQIWQEDLGEVTVHDPAEGKSELNRNWIADIPTQKVFSTYYRHMLQEAWGDEEEWKDVTKEARQNVEVVLDRLLKVYDPEKFTLSDYKEISREIEKIVYEITELSDKHDLVGTQMSILKNEKEKIETLIKYLTGEFNVME